MDDFALVNNDLLVTLVKGPWSSGEPGCRAVLYSHHDATCRHIFRLPPPEGLRGEGPPRALTLTEPTTCVVVGKGTLNVLDLRNEDQVRFSVPLLRRVMDICSLRVSDGPLSARSLVGVVNGVGSVIVDYRTGELLVRLVRPYSDGHREYAHVYACTHAGWKNLYCHIGTNCSTLDCYDVEGSMACCVSSAHGSSSLKVEPVLSIKTHLGNDNYSMDRDNRLKYIATASADYSCKLFDLNSPDGCVGCVVPDKGQYCCLVHCSEAESAFYVVTDRGNAYKYDVRMISNRKEDAGVESVSVAMCKSTPVWELRVSDPFGFLQGSIDQVNEDLFVSSSSKASSLVFFSRFGKVVKHRNFEGDCLSTVALGNLSLRNAGYDLNDGEDLKERIAFCLEADTVQPLFMSLNLDGVRFSVFRWVAVTDY